MLEQLAKTLRAGLFRYPQCPYPQSCTYLVWQFCVLIYVYLGYIVNTIKAPLTATTVTVNRCYNNVLRGKYIDI